MPTEDPSLNFSTPRVAAGVLFTNEAGEVLMVVPSYKDYLDIPGGYVENGETPYEAAKRELSEELGISPPIGRLLVADWWTASPEAADVAKLLFVFEGGALEERQISRIAIDGREVVSVAFVRKEDVAERTIPRLSNRIRLALDALKTDSTVYAENGRTV